MQTIENTKIIGIDHGYGNMKTANFCFKTGVAAYDSEPLFTKNLLIYDGRYYLIGEGHKAYTAEKMQDKEYYVLTLAAIAMELHKEKLTEATVHIAAGLPLTWVSKQKEQFKKYLLQNDEVNFSFRKNDYHIKITGADISKEFLKVLKATATEYVSDIFRRLNDHEYNSDLMKLYVVGGGGCLIRNFGTYDKNRVIINEDISATAKGYEYLSDHYLRKDGEKL